MSHIIECKQVDNANVIFYLHFEALDVVAASSTPCAHLSPDKWLHLNGWHQLYTELDAFVADMLHADRRRDHAAVPSSSASASVPPQHREIPLDSLQLSCSANWRAVCGSMPGLQAASLLHDGGHSADVALHSHYVHARVRLVQQAASVSRIANLEESLLEAQQKLKASSKNKDSNKDRSSDDMTSEHLKESPDPLPLPPPPVLKAEPQSPVEEYGVAVAMPAAAAATPSPAVATAYKLATCRKANHEPYAPLRNASVPSASGNRRATTGANKASSSSSSTGASAKHARIGPLDVDVAAARSRCEVDKPADLKTAADSNVPPPLFTNTYMMRLSEAEAKAVSARRRRDIAEIQEKLKQMSKPPLPDVQVVDMKEMSMSMVEASFQWVRFGLQVHFDAFYAGRMRMVVRPPDVSEYAHQYLLTNKQITRMMEMITDTFGGTENLKTYEDLFWKLLLPEWTVALFMRTYNMSRAEATLRMRQQEEITKDKFKIMDESMMKDTLLDRSRQIQANVGLRQPTT